MYLSTIKKCLVIIVIFSIMSVSLSPVLASKGLANSSWPKDGHDIKNTGHSQYQCPQKNHTIWTKNTSNARGPVTIGADGTIYYSDNKGFHALNSNGKEKWRFNNENAWGSAIDKNGIIYLGCSGGLGSGGELFTPSVFYALYPNGTVKWKITGAKGIDLRNAPTISSDGTIYFSMMDENATNTYLYSVNPDSSINWMFPLYSDPHNLGVVPTTTPAIGTDGTIYINTQIMDGASQNDSNLFAINPDGTLKWKYNFYISSQSSPVIGKDGTIYFGADSDGSKAYFYAIKPDGTLKWKFKAGPAATSPALATDGTIYFGSFDGFFYALDPSGDLKWKFNTSERKEGTVASTSPVIGADGTIYFGCFSNDFKSSYFYALNPDGTVKWRYLTNSGVETNPAIAKDGTLYFGTDDTFYAIKSNKSIHNVTANIITNATIGMQDTGAPLNYLILALFMLISGLAFSKRK